MDDDPIVELCEFASRVEFDSLPIHLVEFAKRHLLDMFAVTLGGSAQIGIAQLAHYVRDKGGKPETTLPFFGGRFPASMVALPLGAMARALDLGDVHTGISEEEIGITGHTAEFTFPALLAATGLRRPVTGREFILAFVIGTEILNRIGIATQGWLSASIHGELIDAGGYRIFGVVIGVAKLLGLSLEQMLNAVGMAKAMTQGHDMAMFSPATLIIRVHHGFMAQDAIALCELAKFGFTGPHNVLAGKLGYFFFHTRNNWPTRVDRLTENLGTAWYMMKTSFKPYCSAKGGHTSAEGLLRLMNHYSFTATDIDRIHCVVSSHIMQTICEPREEKWNPQSDFGAQFSLPYVMSVVAHDKAFLIEQFQEKTRRRVDVRALMSRITVEEDASLGDMHAHLTVNLKDGRRFEQHCTECRGSPTSPFNDTEWKERFRTLAQFSVYPLPRSVVDLLIEKLFNLETVTDFEKELLLPLTPLLS